MRSNNFEIARKAMYTWMEKFFDSELYSRLGDYEKLYASFVIAPFIDGVVAEAFILPEDWNEENLEYFYLVTIPNCSCAPLDFPKHQTRVLEAFFLYLNEQKVINNGVVLAKKIRSLEAGIIEAMRNSKFGKMARKILPPAKINIDDYRDENGQIQRPTMISG